VCARARVYQIERVLARAYAHECACWSMCACACARTRSRVCALTRVLACACVREWVCVGALVRARKRVCICARTYRTVTAVLSAALPGLRSPQQLRAALLHLRHCPSLTISIRPPASPLLLWHWGDGSFPLDIWICPTDCWEGGQFDCFLPCAECLDTVQTCDIPGIYQVYHISKP
jgi:hypothetical protein